MMIPGRKSIDTAVQKSGATSQNLTRNGRRLILRKARKCMFCKYQGATVLVRRFLEPNAYQTANERLRRTQHHAGQWRVWFHSRCAEAPGVRQPALCDHLRRHLVLKPCMTSVVRPEVAMRIFGILE
jgi:hypothetical protein